MTQGTSHTVHIGDNVFSYMDWGGSGPVVHISHSIGFCAGLYSPFSERLKSRFRVIGLDSRGHGETKAQAEPRKLKSWNIFYDDLESFFEHLDTPLIAIGHSMGGTISMMAAIRRPDLVRALVLIEPGIIPPSWIPVTWLLQKCRLTRMVPAVSKIAKKRKEWPSRDDFRSYLSMKRLLREWKEEFVEAYIENLFKESGENSVKLCCNPAWESRCIAVAPVDIWKYVPRIQTPTLVLYGARTKTFLPNVIERFKSKVPSAVLIRLDTGHDVIMENPEASASVILDFLRDVTPF